MTGPSWFHNFVFSVYSDLGERADYAEPYLTSWFLDPSNLGTLNAQIDMDYQPIVYRSARGLVTGFSIEPEMTSMELAIYKANFDTFFYGREAKFALAGSYGTQAWTSLREGDSTITRVNRSELARTFNIMQKDAKKACSDLVKEYLRTKTHAQSVDGEDTMAGGYYQARTDSIYYPHSQPN